MSAKKDLVLCTILLVLGSLSIAQSNDEHILRGRVVADLGGQGVYRVNLTLKESDADEPMELTTDASGEFVFDKLLPGRYELSGEKAGYFSFTEADLSMGLAETLDLGSIVMITKRRITGEVRNQVGDPLPNIFVQPIPVRAGKLAFQAMGRATMTTEFGQFVLEELRPARYVLVVAPSSRSGESQSVVLPQFYPGGDNPMVASALDMTNTPSFSVNAITMDERRGVSVEGMVNPSEFAPQQAEVLVGLLIPGVRTPTAIGLRRTKVGVPFRIYPVPPGQYVVHASVVDRASGVFRRAIHTLTVGDVPVTDLELEVPQPAPIKGKIEIERKEIGEEGTFLEPVAGAQITTYSEKLGGHGLGVATSDGSGQFSLTDTIPGETYSLNLPSSAFPSGTYLASVAQGELDLTGGPLDVVAGGDEVRLLLKDDGATVGGVVLDGSEVKEAFVVLAPKDREAVSWYRTARSDPDDGSFQFEAVAPSRYDLFAFDHNEEYNFLDPAYLNRFRTRAVSVEVLPNSVATYSLDRIAVGR